MAQPLPSDGSSAEGIKFGTPTVGPDLVRPTKLWTPDDIGSFDPAAMEAKSLQIVGEGFTADTKTLTDSGAYLRYLGRLLGRSSVQSLGNVVHVFDDVNDPVQHGGFTSTTTLLESHIAVHTWPNPGYCPPFVALDVYLCSVMRDNTLLVRYIFEHLMRYFNPIKTREREIYRA